MELPKVTGNGAGSKKKKIQKNKQMTGKSVSK